MFYAPRIPIHLTAINRGDGRLAIAWRSNNSFGVSYISWPRLSAVGSSNEKMTEQSFNLATDSSSRLAGGASRKAGSSLRVSRSAPGIWDRMVSRTSVEIKVLELPLPLPLAGCT